MQEVLIFGDKRTILSNVSCLSLLVMPQTVKITLLPVPLTGCPDRGLLLVYKLFCLFNRFHKIVKTILKLTQLTP